MTFIGTFEYRGQRVVIGDLMVSSQSEQQGIDRLPTTTNLAEMMGGVGSIKNVVGLTFKILIPHPRVLVAWSGLMLSAKIFCRDLFDFVRAKRNPSFEISSWLDSYDTELLHGAELFVLWIKNDGSIGEWFHGTVPYELDAFDNLCLAGSGAEDIFGRIAHIAAGIDGHAEVSQYHAAAIGLGVCNEQYGLQSLLGTGIAHGWGGGFEVAIADGMRFRKINAKFSTWLEKTVDGQVYRADQNPSFIIRYYKNHALLTSDGQSAHYIVHPMVETMRTSGILRFPDQVAEWHVASWIQQEAPESYRVSTGARRFGNYQEGWNKVGDGIEIEQKIRDLVVTNGFVIFC